MKKISSFIIVFVLFSGHVFAQERWWEARSSPFHLRIEDPQEALRQLEENSRRAQEQWAAELAAQREALSEDRRISDAVEMTAVPSVTFSMSEDGIPDMSLNIIFSYVVDPQPGTVSFISDDYPVGRYNPYHSNASTLMLEFARNKIETELAQYFSSGRAITINITGETDGAPVLGLPYFGEFGNFYDRRVMLNGQPSLITVISDDGISTNAQLGFLRAQGIENFLRREVAPLRNTNNEFQTFVVENVERGGQYRRISIEMTIHGAFNDRLNMVPQTLGDNNENNNDALTAVRIILPTVIGPAAHNFSNQRLQQHDGTLLVIYDLAAMADVEMFVSFDNGTTFSEPLVHVTGAIGKDVLPGKDRTIIWDVFEEVGYVNEPNTVIKLIGIERDDVIVEEQEDNEAGNMPYYKEIVRIEGGAGIPISRLDEPYKGYNFHLGALYTYNLSPYFGFDLVKVKFETGKAYWNREDCLNCDHERNITTVQAMAGFRLSSPHFGKEKNTNLFTAIRAGAAFTSENGYYWTIGGRDGKVNYGNADINRFRPSMEWDVGVQYKRVYFAVSLNGFYVPEVLHRDWRTFFPFHGIKIGADVLRRHPVY